MLIQQPGKQHGRYACITYHDIKEELPACKIQKGDFFSFASVGAGMHINAFVYRF